MYDRTHPERDEFLRRAMAERDTETGLFSVHTVGEACRMSDREAQKVAGYLEYAGMIESLGDDEHDRYWVTQWAQQQVARHDDLAQLREQLVRAR